MSDTIISVSGLGKCYRIAHQQQRQRYVSLRDVIAEKAKRIFSRKNKADEASSPFAGDAGIEDFWALKDVSFEVKRGEVVGIIGRNGAGKSTLLKILSRITEPTKGRVTLEGRVASLLEVGTGFHPELTGRENIFLNGAILGMHRAEIRRKFDEIVAFAEVEKFLDTPVKRYSSGMYVRLAFAVAAHLEPEILIVDEVLAVGDAEFQRKCLGKMESVARTDGRTVLFVSHTMSAIKSLCNRALLLGGGQLVSTGSVDTVVSQYLLNGAIESDFAKYSRKPGKTNRLQRAFFHSATVFDHLNEVTSTIDVQHGLSIDLVYEVPETMRNLEISIRIITSDGRVVMTSLASETIPGFLEREQMGIETARVTVPGMFLMPGTYLINIALFEPNQQVFELKEGALRIEVEDTGTVFSRYNQTNQVIGVVIKPFDWQLSSLACQK